MKPCIILGFNVHVKTDESKFWPIIRTAKWEDEVHVLNCAKSEVRLSSGDSKCFTYLIESVLV